MDKTSSTFLRTLPYGTYLAFLLLSESNFESPYWIAFCSAASVFISIYLFYDCNLTAKLETRPLFFWFATTSFAISYSISFWLARNDLNFTYGIHTQYLTFSPYLYACLIVVCVFSFFIFVISLLFFIIISLYESVICSTCPFIFLNKQLNKQTVKSHLVRDLKIISLITCSMVTMGTSAFILEGYWFNQQSNAKLLLLFFDSEPINSCSNEKSVSTRYLRINSNQCLKFNTPTGSFHEFRTEIISRKEP